MHKYLHEINPALVPGTHRDLVESTIDKEKRKEKKPFYRVPDKYDGMPNLAGNLVNSIYSKGRPEKVKK